MTNAEKAESGREGERKPDRARGQLFWLCHIIVLAYENKFNLEAAYGNVYARRAQTVVCVCVCVGGEQCWKINVT